MRVKLESRLTIAEAAEARNALLAALALIACNTVEGAGRDIAAAGKAVAKTAADIRK